MPKAATNTPVPSHNEDDLFSIPTTLEPDTYLVKLANLYKREWEGENKFNPGKPNVSIMWGFEFYKALPSGDYEAVLDSETGDIHVFEFSTSTSMSERSTGYKYATALLRHPPTQEEQKSLKSLLIGKKAMAVIGQKDNGYPKIQDLFPYMGK